MFKLCWVQLLCSCLRPARPPAPCGRLNLKAGFVAETRHTRSRTNKLIIMSAATGLTRSCLLAGSARQQPTGRQRHCPGDEFTLESWYWRQRHGSRGRPLVLEILRMPCSRQVQGLFCHGRDWRTSHYRSDQSYFRYSAFERSAIIEEHRNWSCVAMQKKDWVFSLTLNFHSVTSPR